jgi:DNA-binding protein H-NS
MAEKRICPSGQVENQLIKYYVQIKIPQSEIVESNRMKNSNLKSMSVDELWKLHESVVAQLSHRIGAERAVLEDRLRKLGSIIPSPELKRERRPYPKVLPKYRNPKNRSETWAGRGKQPLWLRAQLRSGRKLTDFLIHRTTA